MRIFYTSLLPLVTATSLLFPQNTATAEPLRPNVLLIMADDLGYHDLACYGHPDIKTPVLDRLASNGIRLTGFYAGATVCTPSRMALLTGAYPARVGWSKGVIGHIMEKGTGLSPKATTIAEIFNSSGYRTGIAGKWHLGDTAPLLPDSQGFDESFFIKRSNNQTDTLWRGHDKIERPFENRLLTEKFTREAIRFIKDQESGKPFFLYLPYSAPHFPLEAHPDWKGKSSFGVYGDVIEEMDHRIGEILITLDQQKIAQNTIVVFLSDNGPEPMTKESDAQPYRGKKWDALEGGTRVPCIVRWPGKIPAGTESDAIASAIDLLPTLCHACRIDIASTSHGAPKIDGINVWETLTGSQPLHPGRRDLLYWHGSAGFQAIRIGKWKLFLHGKDTRIPALADRDAPALFDLSLDAAELHDVSARFPDRVKAMKVRALEQLADIHSNMIPLGE